MFLYNPLVEYLYGEILKISTLSLSEYTLIQLNWLRLVEDQFKCKAVEEGYSKRKDAETVIKYHRLKNGCGVIGDNIKVEVDNVAVYTCPCHPNFDYDLQSLLFLHGHYEKGTLGYSGGLCDQPNRYLEVMQLIERLTNEYQQSQIKE